MKKKDNAFLNCYAEDGMIERVKDEYSVCFEVLLPDKINDLSYSSEKAKLCMNKIFDVLSGYDFSFTIRNSLIDEKEYEQYVILKESGDEKIDGYIGAYNSLLSEYMDVGHNNFVRSIYLVVSRRFNTADEARSSYDELEEHLSGAFHDMYGFKVRLLSLEERFSLASDYGVSGSAAEKITKENRNSLLMKERVARMFFINSIPKISVETVLVDVMAVSSDSVLSIYYEPLDPDYGFAAAAREVRNNTRYTTLKIRDTIEDRKLQRKAMVEHPINDDEKDHFMRRTYEDLKVSAAEERPHMLATFLIGLFADSVDELDRDTELLRMSMEKYGCSIKTCDYLQKDAYLSILPFNDMRVDYKRAFNQRHLSSMLPLNIQDIFAKKPMYHGLNAINDNFVLIDRKSCPTGLIAGIKNSGKGFALKREIFNALASTKDEVLVVSTSDCGALCERLGGRVYGSISHDPLIKEPGYGLLQDDEEFKGFFLEALKSVGGETMVKGHDSDESETAFSEERLKYITVGDETELLLAIDYLWNHAIRQKKQGKNIWIFVDEIDPLLYRAATSDYLLLIMDKARKMRLPFTLVIKDAVALCNDDGASIELEYLLDAVEYLKILSLGPVERKRFIEKLNIPASLVPYITEQEPGCGIIMSALNMPFNDRIEGAESPFYSLFAE